VRAKVAQLLPQIRISRIELSTPILPIIVRPGHFTDSALNQVAMIDTVVGAMDGLALVMTIA